jgi:hypothetical protein
MSSDVEEYVRYQIANAPLRTYPYPHFYVPQVFPEDYYREIQAGLPRTEVLTPIHETGMVGILDKQTGELKPVYEPRYIADLAVLEEDEERAGRGQLWQGMSSWLLADGFRDFIIDKFRAGIVERFGADARLATRVDGRFVRDFTEYKILPHTDQPQKLVSLLFYLPGDGSLARHGTALYRPLDASFRCEGKGRYPFERFSKVATMGFMPNALFAFLKTDRSFHGVEPIGESNVERNALLYNIYVTKVVRQRPAAESRRGWWPWARQAGR